MHGGCVQNAANPRFFVSVLVFGIPGHWGFSRVGNQSIDPVTFFLLYFLFFCFFNTRQAAELLYSVFEFLFIYFVFYCYIPTYRGPSCVVFFCVLIFVWGAVMWLHFFTVPFELFVWGSSWCKACYCFATQLVLLNSYCSRALLVVRIHSDQVMCMYWMTSHIWNSGLLYNIYVSVIGPPCFVCQKPLTLVGYRR